MVINGIKHLRPGKGRTYNVLGDQVACKLTGEETSDFFSAFEITVPPGGGQLVHRHLRDEEAYYVLDGQFEFTMGDHIEQSERGTFVHFPRGTLHGYTNIGTTEGKLLAIFAPGGVEYYFEEMDIESKKGSLDTSKVKDIAKRYSILT